MLTSLRVCNFAIIEELEVELGPGLNVVTGETGAGKSILIDALELVLGARARPDVVRTGCESAEVEALFDCRGDPAIEAKLTAMGLPVSDELLIRRSIQASGRTRAYANGRLLTATQLAELTSGLADISSQHEHHTLVDVASHLEYLDAYGRLDGLRERVRAAHTELARVSAELARVAERERGLSEREDLLRYQTREIDELAPEIGEEQLLEEERGRLRHATKLAALTGGAESALSGGDGFGGEEAGESVSDVLARVVADVTSAAMLDPSLGAIRDALESTCAQLDDVARSIGRYSREIAMDPERLGVLEERLDALAKLKRKYGGSLESIVAHRDRAKQELAELDSGGERAEQLVKDKEALSVKAAELAKELRDHRKKAAKKLGKAIGSELTSLGMGDARVLVDVAPLDARRDELAIDGARFSATGIDRVEFLIAPNRGEEPKPLAKVASGGELSRALLAIKRVLSGLRTAGLYVFDEVDSGVGGGVAEVIGRKLKEVGSHHQVLCITHLPQIAVFADAHFRVHKEVVKDRTRSGVRALSDGERLEEIARMLGGLKIGAKTRDAAAEMIREAKRAA